MKTLRKMKKGFTIVELVIVIAVIAVLTAILVPTFISISNKANEASDKSLVKNLNTALRMAEGDQGKKNDTMHDAVEDVKEYAGIILPQFVSKTGDEILWDSVADEFVWKTAKPEGREDVLLWTIVDSYNSANQTYSMYAGSKWSSSAVSVEGLTVGFDVGYNDGIETISYVGVGTERTVVIRTDGGTLNINAPTDTVRHFGYLEHLNVTAVSTTASYHEFGYLKSLDTFGTGRFIAESTAKFGQSRTDVSAVVGENANNLDSVADDQFNAPDPTVTTVEVNQANYSTVFTAANTKYILSQDITVSTVNFVIPEGLTVELDMNGHSIGNPYDVDMMDYFYNLTKTSGDFIDTVSTLINRGILTITGEGTVGGPKGWFGIVNYGTLTLDGPTIIGGSVYFEEEGVPVAFNAVANNGTMTADGYTESQGGHVYSRA